MRFWGMNETKIKRTQKKSRNSTYN